MRALAFAATELIADRASLRLTGDDAAVELSLAAALRDDGSSPIYHFAVRRWLTRRGADSGARVRRTGGEVPSEAFSGRRVVVASDDFVVSRFLRGAFQAGGAAVVTTGVAEAGSATSPAPDLLVVDASWPPVAAAIGLIADVVR